MSEQITILEDMGMDCLTALLNHPHLTVADANVERVTLTVCRAVLLFSDGSSLTGTFNKPDDAPAAFLNTIQSLLFEQSKKIEASILASRELYERVIH